MKRGVYILSLLLFTPPLFINAQQLIFKNYTVQDGLIANPVTRIFQDAKGFIWLATIEGVSKYDGYKFTNFNISNGLSHNMVNDLYETADGKMYIAENNGDVDVIQHDIIVQRAALKNITINKFFVIPGKQVLVGTDANGIHEFNNGTLTKIRQMSPVLSYGFLTEWSDSLLAGGTIESFHILNKQFDVLASIPKPPFYIHCIYTDSKKRLLVGTSAGLKIVSPVLKKNKQLEFAPLPSPFNIPLLANNKVRTILEDHNGIYWIGTSIGLVRLEPDGYWQIYTEKDGLAYNEVNCIFQDREDNIWIGTSLGLSKLVIKNNISIFTTANGLLSNLVLDLYRLDNNKLLINTTDGVQLYSKSKNSFLFVPSENNNLYSFFIKGSSPLLLGNHTKNIIGVYDSVNRRIKSVDGTQLFAGVTDRAGNVIAGNMLGLGLIRGQTFLENSSFTDRISTLVLDKKGFLWAGTWQAGVYRIQYSIINNQMKISAENLTHLITAKEIRSLFNDSKGNVWIGTRYAGLYCLENAESKTLKVKHWDYGSGLSSNWIGTIAEDVDGNIWAGSFSGIDKLVRRDTGFAIFNFSRMYNLWGGSNSIVTEPGNPFWITTGVGLARITDEKLESTGPLPVYISSVWLGTDKNNSRLPEEKKTSLSYRQNQAQFEFSAPSFINEKQILYSYRLAGSEDTAWSKPANVHSVSYASLQPGHYRFEVRNSGWNGKPGTPATFDFIIHPPFWRTWWFFAICALALSFLFYLFYRYRINQLLKLQQVRNRIATDLHDDIGSTLTNINILSELSYKNILEPPVAEKFLKRISEEVTSSSQALDDIIWSVNSRNDSMDETLARMRRYAAELFESSNTTYHLELDENIQNRKLSMEQRRDIFLLFKESLNNVYKHASANHVWIRVSVEKSQFLMQVKDDGKGFDTLAATHRNGWKNMQARAEKWKGTLQLHSEKNKGTTVSIQLPV